MKYDVFISYRREDGKEYARQIQLKLENYGYSVFLDVEELALLRQALSAVGNMVGFVMRSSATQYPRLRERSESVCIFPAACMGIE